MGTTELIEVYLEMDVDQIEQDYTSSMETKEESQDMFIP